MVGRWLMIRGLPRVKPPQGGRASAVSKQGVFLYLQKGKEKEPTTWALGLLGLPILRRWLLGLEPQGIQGPL